MSTYTIDLTDPLKTGFTIQPGGFNGPGGSAVNSTLRLYGRGALEWGEAVDEDLIRLAESFAGSTPPINAIGGQLWYETKFYYLNTYNNSWHVYNPSTYTWSYLGGSLAASQIGTSTTAPSSPSVGTYYFNGTTLYRWDSAYKQAAAAWLSRSYSSGNLGSDIHPSIAPAQTLKVYDEYANSGDGAWVVPVASFYSSSAPANPQIGTLWYDTTTNTLKVYDGTSPNPWKVLLGSAASGSSTAYSNIDMQSTYRVINLPTPTSSGDATSKTYVDTLLSGVYSSYLPLTGGTITGALTISSTLTVGGTFTSSSTNAASFAGALNVAGIVDVGSHRITSVATGTSSTDAVNVQQLNDAITSAVGTLGGISATTVPLVYSGSGTYKAGDMTVVSGKLYIAIASGTGNAPGGSWKQVWPATYS